MLYEEVKGMIIIVIVAAEAVLAIAVGAAMARKKR